MKEKNGGYGAYLRLICYPHFQYRVFFSLQSLRRCNTFFLTLNSPLVLPITLVDVVFIASMFQNFLLVALSSPTWTRCESHSWLSSHSSWKRLDYHYSLVCCCVSRESWRPSFFITQTCSCYQHNQQWGELTQFLLKWLSLILHIKESYLLDFDPSSCVSDAHSNSFANNQLV